MKLFYLPSLIIAILFFLIGAFVFLSKKRLLNFIFFLFCFSGFLWLFPSSLVYANWYPLSAYTLLFKISYSGIIFIPSLGLHCTFILLNKKRPILLFVPYFLSSVSLFYVWTTNFLVSGIKRFYWGYYPISGNYHFLFLAFFIGIISYTCFLLLFGLYRGRHEASRNKQQIKYVLLGFILYSFASIDFFPNYGIEVYPFGYLPAFLFILLFAYAIARHRLLDIKVAITRASIFIFLYAIVLGIPFFVGMSTSSWIYPTSAAVIVATFGPIVYRFLQKRTEDILLAQQRRYQKILLQASVGMIREHNLSRLSKLLVYVVKKTVKVSFTTIFLNIKDQQLYKLQAIRNSGSSAYEISFMYEHPFIMYLKTKDAPFLFEEIPQVIKDSINIPLQTSLIIPFFIDNTLLGFSFLGEKLNKQPYSEDDINVFRILAHQVAMAISNCLFFVEFKNAQEKIFNAEKLASIGGMADGIAHQIKNRLNHFSVASGEMQCEIEDYIKSHPQLMDQNPDLKKSFEYVHQIADSLIKNVKHTDSIIKGILNFARTEEKETFFNYFSLGEVINLSLQLLKVKHEIQDFPLKANLPDNDMIFGVKSQIMESIYNILDNCFEALMEKKGRLSIEERDSFKPLINLELSQTENYSLIIISDNGIGIKEEDKHKIFAPFFTTKSSYKSGSGIGMYVVKRMIEENHHGKITFHSTYLEGVKFRIELPVKK